MKRFLLCLLALGLIPAVLTGCWNYREVTQLTIVAGCAVDLTDEGEYLLTVEVVDLHEAGKEGKLKSAILESRGSSLLDASRNIISTNYPRLYWGHATTVILSEAVARDGITEVLDFLCRDAEPRLSMDLLISHSKTAREIFDAQVLTAEIKSLEIKNILDEEKSLSKAIPVQLYQFINALGGVGVSPITTSIDVIEVKGKKNIRLCGTALFKADKLIGFLGQEDTKDLCFVLNEAKGGILVINLGPKEEDGKVTLEILQNKTKIKPSYNDKKLSVQIDMETTVAMNEAGSLKSYASESEIAALTKKAEEHLKNQIEGLVKKVQTEYGSDNFGFGKCFLRALPNVWREKGSQWDTLFKDLEVTVKPKIKIEHSGLLRKPIQKGD